MIIEITKDQMKTIFAVNESDSSKYSLQELSQNDK